MLDAFRRNRNNSDIDILRLERVDDMNDDILADIIDIVAAAASENVRTISLWFLEHVEKIPEAISRFTKLQVFHIEYLYSIKVLPEGSMRFTSGSLDSIVCAHTNLQMIEPGAFQGISPLPPLPHTPLNICSQSWFSCRSCKAFVDFSRRQL